MDKVVHFEIPFDHKERAHKFYKNVFGWGLIDMPEMNYTIVHTVEIDKENNNMPKEAGAINGGMYKRDANSAQGPVIVIDVADLDEKIKMVEAAGGHVIKGKVKVGDMGWYAQVKDTEGNIIGLWEQIKK